MWHKATFYWKECNVFAQIEMKRVREKTHTHTHWIYCQHIFKSKRMYLWTAVATKKEHSTTKTQNQIESANRMRKNDMYICDVLCMNTYRFTCLLLILFFYSCGVKLPLCVCVCVSHVYFVCMFFVRSKCLSLKRECFSYRKMCSGKENEPETFYAFGIRSPFNAVCSFCFFPFVSNIHSRDVVKNL